MKNILTVALSLLTFATIAQDNNKADAEISIPLRVIESSGSRPAIQALVNGLPVTMVLHSNAGFSMQISHQAALKGNLTNLIHIDNFGIEKPGKLSSLGRDSAFVEQFTVGTHTFSHVPVSVFETPSPFDQGMLGLRWLTTNRVLVDYRKYEVILNPERSTTQLKREQLVKEGFIAIPMKRDPSDGRYLVSVTVNKIVQPMIVSTVSSNIFDLEFANQANFSLKDTGKSYANPTGGTGHIFVVTQPITLQLAGTSFNIPTAQVEDTYAYMNAKKPSDVSKIRAGILGADFLLAHEAIIDFGNATLYLKNEKK